MLIRNGHLDWEYIPNKPEIEKQNKNNVKFIIKYYYAQLKKAIIPQDLLRIGIIKSPYMTPIGYEYAAKLLRETIEESEYRDSFYHEKVKDLDIWYYKEIEKPMNLQQEVNDVFYRNIDSSTLFTAFDITKELRGKFPNQIIFHWMVRKEVDTIYENDASGVTRTYMDIGNGIRAFVYHSFGEDPSLYNKIISVPSSNGLTDNIADSRPLAAPQKPKNHDNVIYPDKNKYVRVGKKHLEEAGFKAGDKVYAMLDHDKEAAVKLFHDTVLPNKGVKPLTVDKWTNLKFCVKNVEKKADKYKVEVKGNTDNGKLTPNQRGSWLRLLPI